MYFYSMEYVILVDESDNEVGLMEKMEAHEKGLLHRAFSIFIFNQKGEMLLQQRAFAKYHSGGLWTNACCSHPRANETTLAAAERRLKEELGFEAPIHEVFSFTYKASFENGLTEHEFDHVFTGRYDGIINFNPDEVAAVKYMAVEDVRNSLQTEPALYTAWFHIAFKEMYSWWQQHYTEV